jgi:dolichol-phosphate mannosyltransferase
MPRYSVVLPCYNEEDNIENTVSEIVSAMTELDDDFEVIVVDDGSSDGTIERAKKLSDEDSRVRVVSYTPNRGRGYAMRMGFAAALGKFVATTDADLSYSADHLPKLFRRLEDDPSLDIVVGSPYAVGGRAEHVPFFRLLISKLGNRVVGRAMGGRVRTVTGMLRAYKRDCLQSLDLESEGKEIHLEILSRAQACGYRITEMPAVLRGRRRGASKFRFKKTASSHLLFSFFERPVLLFGGIGIGLVLLGLIGSGYVIYLWLSASLNPERPLMTLIVLLVLTGIQIALFGFLGTMLVHLRREVYKLQHSHLKLRKQLGRDE